MVLDLCGVAGSPYIKWLVVAPDQRGQGIGAALIHPAEDLGRQQRETSFSLCLFVQFPRSRALYEKLGGSNRSEKFRIILSRARQKY